MTTKEQDLAPAITLLDAQYVEAQKVANGKLVTLNAIREAAGLPPRAPGIEGQGSEGGPVLTQIKRDTFYGKKQMTAMREYLDMRRVQGDGPATPREILDALKAGGYKFEAKSDDIALVSLRALLRKATNVFHKLPGTNSYGLLSWYPNAKPTKEEGTGGGLARRKPKSTESKSKRRGRPPNPKGQPASGALKDDNGD
ncbi:MAG TPA: hypothetical protein VGG48_01025 [Rhizomicrobium sp.]